MRRWAFLRIKRWRSGREIGETVLVGENDVEIVLVGGARFLAAGAFFLAAGAFFLAAGAFFLAAGAFFLAAGAFFLAAGAFFLAAGALGLLFALRGSDFSGIPIPVVVCVQFKVPLTVKNTTGAVHLKRAHKTLFFSFSGSNRAPGHGTALVCCERTSERVFTN